MESDSLQKAFNASRERAFEDFFTFLKFQSVSSEPDHTDDMRDCADWLIEFLNDLGFETELWETSKHPVIFSSWMGAGKDKPTLLIYNHYDVQPVDPIELWETPPFEPTVREGEVFARGAQDNKGQCFYVLYALKLLLEKEGKLPVNVKLFIEGGEEIGSVGTAGILEEKKTQLQADYLAIVDLGMPKPDVPTITLGTRGMLTMDVVAHGSNVDLHSGFHGGIVFNPIHALVEMLAKLRGADGEILIPGFYDDVKELQKQDRTSISFDFDEKEYREMFGAKPTGGESAYPPLESAWIRPTLEINGIWGGYMGEGFKTVIPAKAGAKVSCRLVPDQDPAKIGSMVKKFLEINAPEGIEVTVNLHEGSGTAVRSDPQSKGVQSFAKAYEEIFGKPCRFIFEGGSIPIVPELSAASGGEVVMFGLGLPGDRIHAPNEHFGLDRIEKGVLLIGRALQHLSRNA